jgi:hypothetical protein
MKKQLIILFAAVMALAACNKDNMVAVVSSNVTAPKLSAPANNTAYVVTVADSSKVVDIKWSKADYGVNGVLNYVVQIAASGTNFKTPVNLAVTNGSSYSTTQGGLNNRMLNDLGLPPNVASDVDLRIGSILGKDTVWSDVVKLKVTTYKELFPDRLWVPGAYQGWAPGTAPTIPYGTDGKYEGYVYMSVGDEFKFTSAPDWVHTNFGYAGTLGKLTTDGLAGGVKVASAGYYKLNADLKNLTYSTYLVASWGLIGPASAGGWDNSTPMTYNQTTKVWSITTNLAAGALKFRANNSWDLNYGPASITALSGQLIQTNDAVTINEAGRYTITLDFSQSTQAKYLYTITKN